MNPWIKQTGLRKSLHTTQSTTQPAVYSSFKPWGSYSKKGRVRLCTPHTQAILPRTHTGKWTHDTLPDKKETILCLGKKKPATWPTQAEEKSPTGEHHNMKSWILHMDSSSLAWALTMAWPPETTRDFAGGTGFSQSFETCRICYKSKAYTLY